MRFSELDTPAVVVDLDILERNLKEMAEYCSRHGLSLRPHTKTHKIPDIARMQVRSGARGITVAKMGEAELMVREGFDDILIAYPLVGPIRDGSSTGSDRAHAQVSGCGLYGLS